MSVLSKRITYLLTYLLTYLPYIKVKAVTLIAFTNMPTDNSPSIISRPGYYRRVGIVFGRDVASRMHLSVCGSACGPVGPPIPQNGPIVP